MVTYADRPWVKFYDTGVPATLNYPQIPLHTYLQETARNMPNHTALITSARVPKLGRLAARLTYSELDRLSDELAAGLVALGLKKGESVALVLPNSVQFVVSYYAILKAGGVVAATNPTYPADKMQYQLDDCDAPICITLTPFYNLIKAVQPQTKIKHVIATNIKEYLPPIARILFSLAKEKKQGHYLESVAEGDVWLQDLLKRHSGQKSNVEVSADDLCLFQYTGGTTGVSKAAMATHANLVANTLQQEAFLGTNGRTEPDTFLGAIPFFHVYGMVSVITFASKVGATIALVPNARDIDDVIDVINTFKPTLFHGVPALYNAINQHPKVVGGEVNLTSLRASISGSAPLPPSVKNEFERVSGGVLREGFGMSETPTVTHVNPLLGENRAGSIGLPVPDTDCRIVSLDDGRTIMPVGEIGELIMTGPQIMKGYYKMPTETTNTLRELEGKLWVYSGDIARMDEDGYFYIVDRKKDMVIVGGFNVYPTQIEKVLRMHDNVLEAAVAGIPHPTKEGLEALKAWIVVKPGTTVSEDELKALCKKHLAPHEVPTRYAFIPELPKTAVGKTLRRELVRVERERQQQA
jgi:long-chain acyl-CoA synthetase